MKKYLIQIIISLLQIFIFYFLPKLIGNIGALGMVFLLLLITFILSMLMGFISNNKVKYCYPFLVSSIFIYYNESALIHSVWYFVISIIGLLLGMIVRLIFKRR